MSTPNLRGRRRSVKVNVHTDAKGGVHGYFPLAKPKPDGKLRVQKGQRSHKKKKRKNKRYGEAIDYFKRAKECYAKANTHEPWRKLVEDVRKRHSHKWSFMPGFEELSSDIPRSSESTFMARAKARWASKRKTIFPQTLSS